MEAWWRGYHTFLTGGEYSNRLNGTGPVPPPPPPSPASTIYKYIYLAYYDNIYIIIINQGGRWSTCEYCEQEKIFSCIEWTSVFCGVCFSVPPSAVFIVSPHTTACHASHLPLPMGGKWTVAVQTCGVFLSLLFCCYLDRFFERVWVPHLTLSNK